MMTIYNLFFIYFHSGFIIFVMFAKFWRNVFYYKNKIKLSAMSSNKNTVMLHYQYIALILSKKVVNMPILRIVQSHTCLLWQQSYHHYSDEKTFLQYFLEILKRTLHNPSEILKKCTTRVIICVAASNIHTVLPVVKRLTPYVENTNN